MITLDGDHPQVEAILKLQEECDENQVEVLKWAAACSLTQQPADVGDMHKRLHAMMAQAFANMKKESSVNGLWFLFVPISCDLFLLQFGCLRQQTWTCLFMNWVMVAWLTVPSGQKFLRHLARYAAMTRA